MAARVLVAVAMAWASACAATQARRPAARRFDPTGREIRQVRVYGNHYVCDDDDIADVLALRVPQGFGGGTVSRFDPLTFELDRRRVKAFYRARGYFDVELVGAGVVDIGYGFVGIWYQVREGEPTRIARVTLDGLDGLAGVDPKPLLDGRGLTVGDVFHHPDYVAARRRIERQLVDAGYAHARVAGTVKVDRDRRTAIIELRADAGPLVQFGAIDSSAIASIPREAVEARVAWDRGDRFDPEKLERTKQRLRALNLLGRIRADYEKDGRPSVADVALHGRPLDRHELRVGGGVAADTSRGDLRARAGLSVKRWPFALSTTRLDLEGAYTFYSLDDHERSRVELDLGDERAFTYEAGITLEQFDLVAPRTQWWWNVAYDRNVAEAYTTRGPKGHVKAQLPLASDRLLVAARFQVASFDVDPDDAALAAGLAVEDPIRLAFLEESVTWDNRDHKLDARTGFYANLELQQGTAPLFLRGTFELRLYRRLFVDRLVGALRGRIGLLDTLEEGESAPLTQRYYAGGSASHRGFSFRRLSPTIPDDSGQLVPIGGSALLELSAETRIDLTKIGGQWLGAVVFVDAGDVTSETGALALGDLHWAVGAGLRYDTPLGPFRLDAGLRLTRTGPGEPDADAPYAFHISFGEAF